MTLSEYEILGGALVVFISSSIIGLGRHLCLYSIELADEKCHRHWMFFGKKKKKQTNKALNTVLY